MERFPNLATELASALPRERRPTAPDPWELAEKIEVPAQLLVKSPSDQLGRVFLAFALAFNDLKGVVLLEKYVLAFERPAPGETTPYAGQWYGLKTQVHRTVASIVHEVMEVIRANASLLAGREMEELVASLESRQLAAWRELSSVAQAPPGTDARTLLHKIRNKMGFHYDLKELANGYALHFKTDAASKPSPQNSSAQYSAGLNMDGTRFYFADAAAQRRMMEYGVETVAAKADDELVRLARRLNEALGPLVVAFIKSRAQLDAADRSG